MCDVINECPIKISSNIKPEKNSNFLKRCVPCKVLKAALSLAERVSDSNIVSYWAEFQLW